MNSFIITDETDSSMYFAEPLDLDYDEPNSVVEDMEVEFIVAEEFVQMVELPVVSPVEASPVKERNRMEPQRHAA